MVRINNGYIISRKHLMLCFDNFLNFAEFDLTFCKSKLYFPVLFFFALIFYHHQEFCNSQNYDGNLLIAIGEIHKKKFRITGTPYDLLSYIIHIYNSLIRSSGVKY